MSRYHACGLRNSECHVCVRKALSWPSERDPEALCLEDLGRRRVELKVWRRTERGLQVEEEESVVFSNIEVRVKRAGPSGLGDLEATEYIARIRSGPFEREDGAPALPPSPHRDCLQSTIQPFLNEFTVQYTCT